MQVSAVYYPKGVCSQLFNIKLKDGAIEKIEVKGGCQGNLEGLSRLLQGMDAREAIERLKGIPCGMKPTSCPDQIAIALEKMLK